MNICIHGLVKTDCPYCQTDTTIAQGKLANKINMGTQWKKFSEEQPKRGQAIWYRYCRWKDSDQSSFDWSWTESRLNDIIPNDEFIWCEAILPPPFPNGSEAAFEEWWNNYRTVSGADFLTPKAFSKVAWDAALAWHKNKTKE